MAVIDEIVERDLCGHARRLGEQLWPGGCGNWSVTG